MYFSLSPWQLEHNYEGVEWDIILTYIFPTGWSLCLFQQNTSQSTWGKWVEQFIVFELGLILVLWEPSLATYQVPQDLRKNYIDVTCDLLSSTFDPLTSHNCDNQFFF